MFKRIKRTMKPGKNHTFLQIFYEDDFTIFNLRDIDAELRCELRSIVNSTNSYSARNSIKTLHGCIVQNTKELLNFAQEIYHFLDTYKIVKRNNYLTLEDIKNLQY
ncbi:MAG: hypothetical protein IKM43_03880 [Clostridia bacterium]|nr:hypothetical protein [Clostridia bacterium]